MPFDLPSRDLGLLARAWRRAKPFPHLVLDDVLPEPEIRALGKAFGWEPHTWQDDELHSFLASGDRPSQRLVAAVHEELESPESLAAVTALSGREVRRVDLRAYTYLAGNYLLPHTDHREEVGRQVAYAFYVGHVDPLRGGELELFACRRRAGRIVETQAVKRIAPRRNRLVLFEVSDVSLHQVREVTQGARMSLAGWFLT